MRELRPRTGNSLLRLAGFLLVTLFIMMGLAPSTARAQCDTTWIGGSGDWFTAENWSSGAVPTGSTNVCASGAALAHGESASVNDLTVSAGGTLNLYGAGNIDGVGGGAFLAVYGSDISNSGNIDIVGVIGKFAGDAGLSLLGSNVTLSGGGTVTLSSGASFIYGTQTNTLTNQDNTIEGGGILAGFSFINNGTVLGNSSSDILLLSLTSFTNNGTLEVAALSQLAVMGGTFTNYSAADGGTLTGGTYIVGGTLSLPGPIQTSAATIVLDGNPASFGNLAGFATNTASGSFTIQNGANFTTAGDFSNSGVLTVGDNSTFQTGPGVSNNFNQSGAGSVTQIQVGGTLTTVTFTLGGGTLTGAGAVIGAVNNTGGTVQPGDAPGKLTIQGNYTQGSAGTLSMDIGGASACNGANCFSQLVVAAGATLAGTLDLNLVNGFTPFSGETFTILIASNVTGTFSAVNLFGGPAGTFAILYTSTSVIAVWDPPGAPQPEPGTLLLVGTGLICTGALLRRRKK